MAASTNERTYNFGIAEGKQLVKDYLDDEDIIDIALGPFDKKSVKRIERSDTEDLVALVRNFIDGLEDGVKSQCARETAEYIKWLRSQS